MEVRRSGTGLLCETRNNAVKRGQKQRKIVYDNSAAFSARLLRVSSWHKVIGEGYTCPAQVNHGRNIIILSGLYLIAYESANGLVLDCLEWRSTRWDAGRLTVGFWLLQTCLSSTVEYLHTATTS
jgi:hypothetical protein